MGWDCRENGERVRAYRTHPTFGLQLAVFLAEPLIPTAAPSSLPWERVRERATSRKACIWAVSVLGKIAEIRGMPSPQPSPTGEGADCSGFKRYRSSEKRMPEISTAGIFQAAFIARQMEQTPRAFFQTTFEPKRQNVCRKARTRWVGVVGKMENACVPRIHYMRATACYVCLLYIIGEYECIGIFIMKESFFLKG